MRAKRRGRPLSRTRIEPPPGVNLLVLATQAVYVASPEHKDRYTPRTGVPKLRTDASPCPPSVSMEEAQTWLRTAIKNGRVGGPWDVQPFPQYAWHRRPDGGVFEARLTNAELGQYKGYPLDAREYPSWL